jgi:hypothetical protein
MKNLLAKIVLKKSANIHYEVREIIVPFVFTQSILMNHFHEIELQIVSELCFLLDWITKKTKAI